MKKISIGGCALLLGAFAVSGSSGNPVLTFSQERLSDVSVQSSYYLWGGVMY